jgi:hypothetical protein
MTVAAFQIGSPVRALASRVSFWRAARVLRAAATSAGLDLTLHHLEHLSALFRLPAAW